MGKKKGKSSAKKGKRIVDGISTAEMTREQLMGHIKRLQNEIDREREERNFFMLEREKLFSLWSLALEKLTIEKDAARLKEVHLDDVRESKEEEITFFKEKLRFLMSEQVRKLSETRLDYLYRMKQFQTEFWKIQCELREKVTEHKSQLKVNQLALFQSTRSLQLEHLEKISTCRKEFWEEIRRIEVASDLKVIKQREISDLECKQDMILLQVTKDEQINQLIQTHEKQLVKLKNYFKELTVNNLAIISTLQEEVLNRKSNEEKLQLELLDSQVQCHDLGQSLKEYKVKFVEWTEEEKKMVSRIRQVRRNDMKMEKNQRYCKFVELANETLIQKNLKLEQEYDFLKGSLGKAIMEMQMKTTMNSLAFQLKLDKSTSY